MTFLHVTTLVFGCKLKQLCYCMGYDKFRHDVCLRFYQRMTSEQIIIYYNCTVCCCWNIWYVQPVARCMQTIFMKICY